MLPDKNKTKLLNEGRFVGGKFFNYGGFPRILKETSGVVSQFNDSDDSSPKDEKVATHPDGVEELEKQLAELQDRFGQAEIDFSGWSMSSAGRKMSGEILDLKNKIFQHPTTQAKIKAAEAARAAEGPGFFSRRAKDPDWLHDASQRGEMVGGLPAPSETLRERGLGLGP
jgi:hypothetical protein